MTKLFALFGMLVVFGCGYSDRKEKGTSEVTALEQRIAEYMKYSDEMNLDKVMDYIYPKLFTIASRKQLQKAMEDVFYNDEMSIDLDSVKLEKLHPVFEMDGGSFAKVEYSMLMIMKLNEDQISKSQTDMLQQNFESEFGEGNVSFDETGKSFRIRQNSTSIAVKDKYAKEWSFAELNKDDEDMLKKIFSKKVLDKLDTYN